MLISLLVVVVIAMLLCWLISILPVPNSPPIKTILYIIVIIGVIAYLLRYI